MDIEQRQWTAAAGWVPVVPGSVGATAQLVFVFGAPAILRKSSCLNELTAHYPRAHIVGCSTAGEICGTQVRDDSLVATAVRFERTKVKTTHTNILPGMSSFAAGQQIATALADSELVHVVVLSDGIHVNGSELVRGLLAELPPGVTATGGLAGDGARFQQTFIYCDGDAAEARIIGLGFYGSRLQVGFGSMGGWDPFGPERLITHAVGNVLYELDGRSALALYKQYLGPYAADLPASGLLFPLSLRTNAGDVGIVRTILAVNEADQSITFAGDMPESAYARLMKANFDRLIDGATGAARTSYEAIGSSSPDLARLISCVGRKLVLKQRIEEEVESVRNVLGDRTTLMGFYSYGEISPLTPSARCELHNQTMTITTFAEH
jgi:hypothetical protein